MKILATLFASLLPLFSLSALQEYQIIDMGLTKYEKSTTCSINDLGQVCGIFLDHKKYVYFFDSKENKFNYTQVDTITPPFINNQSKIYGSYLYRKEENSLRFHQESVYCWENPQSYFTYFNFHDIGFPQSQKQEGMQELKRNILMDVNDQGQFTLVNTGDPEKQLNDHSNFKFRTWVFDETIQEITNPKVDFAIKINNNSLVLGFSLMNGVIPTVYNLKNGKTTVLPFPEGSFGTAINDKDQIAGAYLDPNDKERKSGFLLDYTTYDFLTIDNFFPHAINNHGVIIGHFMESNKPAIWEKGCLCDISDLVDLIDNNGQQWESIKRLTDINDEGYIVGHGIVKGKEHALLLIPVNIE